MMVKTLQVPSWEYVGMRVFMPTYTCAHTSRSKIGNGGRPVG